MKLFKLVRIAIILTILVIVAAGQLLKQQRLASWRDTVLVTVYPLIADGRDSTLADASRLSPDSFDDIGSFFAHESQRYGRALSQPVRIQVARPSIALPPAVPESDNPLAIAWWSLQMRWWTWRQGRQDQLPAPDIQVFVLYRDGQGTPVLDRSVGLRKGMFALVNAYALQAMATRNRVVITHELLHVLGATDKYSAPDNWPVLPDGFADPEQVPLYPQRQAEIMGGRIPLAPGRARMPASLSECVIGRLTASEIGWR